MWAVIPRSPDGYFHCWVCEIKIANSTSFVVSLFLSSHSFVANRPPAPRPRLSLAQPRQPSTSYPHARPNSSPDLPYPTIFVTSPANIPAFVLNSIFLFASPTDLPTFVAYPPSLTFFPYALVSYSLTPLMLKYSTTPTPL